MAVGRRAGAQLLNRYYAFAMALSCGIYHYRHPYIVRGKDLAAARSSTAASRSTTARRRSLTRSRSRS